MDVRQLKNVVVLAEELNFRKAAKRLNMTQPPLSRQVKMLEEELDVQLFIRSSKGVKLTEAGAVFVKEAKKILDATDRLKSKLQAFQRNQASRIGYMGFASIAFIPQLASHLAKIEVESALKDFSTNQILIDALLDKAIDYAFHYPTAMPDKLESQIVYEEPIVIVMHKDHPLAEKQFLDMEDFSKEKYIMPPASTNPIMSQRFQYMTHVAGFKPNIIHEVNTHQGRLNLVAQGLGITFDGISVKKLNVPNLIYKAQHPSYDVKAQVMLSWRKGEQHPKHEQIMECFKNL